VEDVAMEESDAMGSHATTEGSLDSSSNYSVAEPQSTQPDPCAPPSTQPEFGPSISTALRTVCLKPICSERVIHFLIFSTHFSLD
jgi:hypothetical protein